MKNIAIITARGGSKRIPRKNIKDFMGKPIIAYSIEACLGCNVFDEIMVSTDCPEIAEIAKQYGAKVPFMRSAKTSDDFATTFDVVQEVINKYKENAQEFDNACFVYPCAPFLTAEILNDAYRIFSDSNQNALLPVCKYPTPVEWAMRIKDGSLIQTDSTAHKLRSQDIEPKYFDVGMFGFCKISSLLESKTLVPEKTFGYVIDELHCQDIDSQEDWQMAELKYKILNTKRDSN